MHEQSLNSVARRFPERSEILESLRAIALRLLAEDPMVDSVELFGSLTRGNHGVRSDADVLVRLKDPRSDRPTDRIPTYLASFLDAPVPVDVFPFTVGELRRLLDDGSFFWKRALAERITLASRGQDATTS